VYCLTKKILLCNQSIRFYFRDIQTEQNDASLGLSVILEILNRKKKTKIYAVGYWTSMFTG